MPSRPYKIFYSDGTKLLWSDVAPNGDPRLIPRAKRVGVHSVIQKLTTDPTQRETIEQYHYVYSIREDGWIGVGVDGLLEMVVNDFADIRCIMHGRTMTTDTFFTIRQSVREDPDIAGGASLESNPVMDGYANDSVSYHRAMDPYATNSFSGWYDELLLNWSGLARHRAYDDRVTDDQRGQQEYLH
jgi:hypothetical protein